MLSAGREEGFLDCLKLGPLGTQLLLENRLIKILTYFLLCPWPLSWWYSHLGEHVSCFKKYLCSRTGFPESHPCRDLWIRPEGRCILTGVQPKRGAVQDRRTAMPCPDRDRGFVHVSSQSPGAMTCSFL